MKYTENEIKQQPDLWLKVYSLVKDKKSEVMDFLSAFSIQDTEFIFTGAGSSFYVAQVVSGIFQKNTGFTSKCVSTTELVTHPQYFLNPVRKTVLVSFARSGESPESMAAVRNADVLSKNVHHLIITCNAGGTLANIKTQNPKLAIVLPPEANDKSLAMTSSVTSMILTAILVSRIKVLDYLEPFVDLAADYARNVFERFDEIIQEVALQDFDRAVFLGSGPMLGIAREAHLKIQELTDGEIIGKFDSFLGFRHGPKAVVTPKTLVVYHCSNNQYVQQYEQDLIRSVANQNPLYTLAVCEGYVSDLPVDTQIFMTHSQTQILNEDFLVLYSLVPAQLLAMYKSLQLGYNPDSPSRRGAIHRVVQGVKIYEYKSEEIKVNSEQ